MNEAVNDSAKLIAQAINEMKAQYCQHCTNYPGNEEIIIILEQALDKLATNI